MYILGRSTEEYELRVEKVATMLCRALIPVHVFQWTTVDGEQMEAFESSKKQSKF